MTFDITRTSDTSHSDSLIPRTWRSVNRFDVTLCGQCCTCQSYFPCEQLYVLQIQSDGGYQDTGRLICFECHRSMNLRVYQTRELTRQERKDALCQWLAERQPLSES